MILSKLLQRRSLLKASKIPTDKDLTRDKAGSKKYIGTRLNRDTYYILRDIKEANGLKSIDETIRSLVQFVALAATTKDN